ncbi:MAG: alcohol dehydrogenase catalytic domain-containing protein [Propionibacteriaceae bacterium]|jgi:threonine dehydrogenase-like Zn-dependent dehydrogenase|nr:alcohol dehydrogenase catalytic domain-containing protein [Propionibacteriaceae bacterium]
MRAAVFHGPFDITADNVPDPQIKAPHEVIVKVLAGAVCGSDLWTYRGESSAALESRIGHEFVGEIVAVGTGVEKLKVGDVAIAPFRYSDGECPACKSGWPSSCAHGGFWGWDSDGGQGEYVRVPYAQATLVKLDEAPDAAALPDLLTLADVMSTGMHAATSARVAPGDTAVVVGDGAVGLCAVIAAKLRGAGRIIVFGGKHPDRQALARQFGADEVHSARGPEATNTLKGSTGGIGADVVLECVGSAASFETALTLARPGGRLAYVGLPHGVVIDVAKLFRTNVSVSGGLCPARRYIEPLLPEVLGGGIHPGRVFTTRLPLADIAEAYRQMDKRETIKVLVTP